MQKLKVLILLALLPLAQVHASHGYPDFVRLNMREFVRYDKNGPATNAPVVSWAPVRELVIQEGVKRNSAKQVLIARTANILLPCCCLLLIVLGLTHVAKVSRGFAWCLWLFAFLPSLGLSHEWDGWEWYFFLAAASIIVMRDSPRAGQIFAGLICVALLAAFISKGLLVDASFAYLDDYIYPRYSTVTCSTNTIAVYEKLDLRKRPRKNVLFTDGRVRILPTNELKVLLSKQAAEVEAALDSTSHSTRINRQQDGVPNANTRR